MKNTFILLFFFLLCFSLKAQDIPISDSLIYKMSVSNSKNNEENEKIITNLSEEFSSYDKPLAEYIEGNNTLSVFYSNFDSDLDIELIAFIGYASESQLLVFNKIDNQWFLIYREKIDLDSNQSLLYGICPTEKMPLIWIKYYDGHGTGAYTDTYFFYKFTSNGFKKVLVLAGENWVNSGAISTMNFNLKNTFESYPFGELDVIVKCKYYLPYDYTLGERKSLILFNKSIRISFKWSEEKQEYYPSFRNYYDLSESQQEFLLLQKENQESFIDLFRIELYEMRKDLSERELEVLDEWINHVMENSKSKK